MLSHNISLMFVLISPTFYFSLLQKVQNCGSVYTTLAEKLLTLGFKRIMTIEQFDSHRSNSKTATIYNQSFQNEKIRKVRLTYFDGGQDFQVRKETQ